MNNTAAYSVISMVQLPHQSPVRLLDPFLYDLLMARILTQLPPATLGALRGTCISLRDLLDSQASSDIWSAIAGRHCLELPMIECPHLQDLAEPPLDKEHSKYCSQCCQVQLRGWAQAVHSMRAGDGQIQARAWPPYGIKSVLWSPCSRWVAIIWTYEAVASYDSPRFSKQYGALVSSVSVTDIPNMSESLRRRPASQGGCQTMGWRVTDTQWLPATMDQSSRWLVFTTRSPFLGGMFRCGLICIDAISNTMEEVMSSEGQQFQLAVTTAGSDQQPACKAAAWSESGNAVQLYQLPDLQPGVQLQAGRCTTCTSRAISFSPDAARIAVWWDASEEHLLAVHDTDTGDVLLVVNEPADARQGKSLYNILAWSPTSHGLLFCMNSVYYVLGMSAGGCAATGIKPKEALSHGEESDKVSLCGWMPSVEVAIVTGMRKSLSNPSSASVSHFVLRYDGSVLGQWTGPEGWQRCHGSHAKPSWGLTHSLVAVSASAEATWKSVEPLLDPFWSPMLLGQQGRKPLGRNVLERINEDLPLGCQNHNLEQTELSISPCGKVISSTPPTCQKGQKCCILIRCVHNVSHAVYQATSLPAWSHFAWHPAAGMCPIAAMAGSGNDILLVSAKTTRILSRWRLQDLLELYGGPDPSRWFKWTCLAWAPDGTKLLLIGGSRIITIDVMKPQCRLLARSFEVCKMLAAVGGGFLILSPWILLVAFYIYMFSWMPHDE